MFFESVKLALLAPQPEEKIARVTDLHEQLHSNEIDISAEVHVDPVTNPGRPSKPALVHPSQVARRKLTTEAGRVALIHAICHIEFNAINLALDAAYRFRELPREYYRDWLQVATEESRHFLLLSNRLQELNSGYGELAAHNSLWEMAIKTQHSIVERMALVPRVLEARGLDVTPGMIERLQAVPDGKTVEILEVILHDEEGHVEIGSKWFRYACIRQGLNPEETFISLLKKYNVTTGKGPLHLEARKRAGFCTRELQALSSNYN